MTGIHWWHKSLYQCTGVFHNTCTTAQRTQLAGNCMFCYTQLLPGAVPRCYIHSPSTPKARVFSVQYHNSLLGNSLASDSDVCPSTGDWWASDAGNRVLSCFVVRHFDSFWQRPCHVRQLTSYNKVPTHFHGRDWGRTNRELHLAESLQKVRDAAVGESSVPSLLGQMLMY